MQGSDGPRGGSRSPRGAGGGGAGLTAARGGRAELPQDPRVMPLGASAARFRGKKGPGTVLYRTHSNEVFLDSTET